MVLREDFRGMADREGREMERDPWFPRARRNTHTNLYCGHHRSLEAVSLLFSKCIALVIFRNSLAISDSNTSAVFPDWTDRTFRHLC